MRTSALLGLIGLAAAVSVRAEAPERPSTLVGDLQVRTFKSTIFGDTQTLRVWLPPGYRDAAQASRRYPVLIMFDGQNLFDNRTATFGTEWKVDETVTDLVGKGRIEPVIVVGIDSPGDRRSEEYLPYVDPMNPDAPEVHGDRMPEFLVSEVLSRVDAEFRTRKDRSSRAVGGSSYGGIAALYALIRRPDIFGRGLIESAPLNVGNGRLLREASGLALGPERVVVGIGDSEIGASDALFAHWKSTSEEFDAGWVAMNVTLARELKESYLTHPKVLYVVGKGHRHQEKAWAERFPAAIEFLFPASPSDSPRL
jgi:predicted alpha/beta superfamily hydrolase